MHRLMRVFGFSAALFVCASCGTPDVLPYSDARIADDGTYPNLNVVPVPAAAPMSSTEAQAQIQAVQAARPAPRGLPTSESEAVYLRRLGRTHGQEALRQIEASGN
ncbi:DNA repair protein RecO C-terminal domain-containing protein [Notoacmeibacter sp. MSK16QG-6]|uniref:DNA repair protein RecO C-terminal domain-containing protein n=1 Tax=Notoacmeibacter sp. MSK16QG-6 TaxID=2957982 RepID=UPI00209DCD66|nr:DNA repair protein RecO C-terminal domain-containing protein [Notoacmeibacter sp. MSK16QG-6]MCP1199370.1 DNA repair protein RecO C-terminal domain-containing protein [Notoacmeibacter sp. MSK16QG-6]